MPSRYVQPTWTKSNRATKLGADHRECESQSSICSGRPVLRCEVVARCDYFWPYLRPLWRPKSHATWLLHLQNLKRYLHVAPDRELIPFEIIIAAAEHGRGHLSNNEEYQRHALKHFLCPWNINDCLNCLCHRCHGRHIDPLCCSADAYSPPIDPHPHTVAPLVDLELPIGVPTTTYLLRDLIAELQLRWGKNREKADSRLALAVGSAVNATELAENDRTCALCQEDFDDDKVSHMEIAGYEHTFPCEEQHDLKELVKHDNVLDAEYIESRLDTDNYYNTIFEKVHHLGAEHLSTFYNEWRAVRAGTAFVWTLGIASASLNRQRHARDDGCCGRPVITSCCKQVLGMDCLRKSLDPEFLLDEETTTHRAPTCPLCRHNHKASDHQLSSSQKPRGLLAMLRQLDGSWTHYRYPLENDFLPANRPRRFKETQRIVELISAPTVAPTEWPTLQESHGLKKSRSVRTALAAVSRTYGNMVRE